MGSNLTLQFGVNNNTLTINLQDPHYLTLLIEESLKMCLDSFLQNPWFFQLVASQPWLPLQAAAPMQNQFWSYNKLFSLNLPLYPPMLGCPLSSTLSQTTSPKATLRPPHSLSFQTQMSNLSPRVSMMATTSGQVIPPNPNSQETSLEEAMAPYVSEYI